MAENNNRILVLGLDNSGKTSIVFSLLGKNLLSLHDQLIPTIGQQMKTITVQGNPYMILDFGGQEVYRNDVIKNSEKYFLGVGKILYLIDIQDTERYNLALDYLEEIIKILEARDEKPKLVIFLHKYDPNLELEIENIKPKVRELLNKIRYLISNNLDYTIKKSTIFTVFKSSDLHG